MNGLLNSKLSGVGQLPHGVQLHTQKGFELIIPDKVILEEMIHLFLLADANAARKADGEGFAIKISAGVSTRLNFVLHKTGAAEFCPQKMTVDIHLSENACVDYYQIEEVGVKGKFETINQFHLKKHASLDYLVFAASDGASNNRTTVDFDQEHGFFSAKGLTMLSGQAKANHWLTVNHRAGHCISRQYFKSVLAEHSHASFESLVHVYPAASKSDSQQLNRNLLLSDNAQARSKPELQIDNDDVAASHGSASGQLDDNELFYLQSRGLSKESARLVLVDGFAEEIVGNVSEKDLKSYLEAKIHDGIQAMVGSIQ